MTDISKERCGDDMRPCPFCGATAEHDSRWWHPGRKSGDYPGENGHAVICSQCEASVGLFDTADAAINAWNQRATAGLITALQERVESADTSVDELQAHCHSLEASLAEALEVVRLMVQTQAEWEAGVAKIIGREANVFGRVIDKGQALLAKHGGRTERTLSDSISDVDVLRHQCAKSGFHGFDGCDCSDDELLRRAKHGVQHDQQ